MAARLFVTLDPSDPSHATLDADGTRHLRALRLAVGDAFTAIVGAGCERAAVVERISASGARCHLGEPLPASNADPSSVLVLAIGLADLARMDLVVEKATELGASAIAPFRAARSQRGDVPRARLTRWERIARAACEQCGRTIPPAIEPLATFAELLGVVDRAAQVVLFAPGADAQARPLASSAAGRDRAEADRAGALLIVGPEGGLTNDEIARLVERGATTASLGPRVLRFETAAIAALATYGASSAVPFRQIGGAEAPARRAGRDPASRATASSKGPRAPATAKAGPPEPPGFGRRHLE